MYTIGIPNNPEWEATLHTPLLSIREAGMQVERIKLPDNSTPPWQIWPEKTHDPSFAWLVPLPWCRLEDHPGLVITALTKRQDPAYKLVFSKNDWSESLPMKIARGAAVTPCDILSTAYLTDARPDLKLVHDDKQAARICDWMASAPAALSSVYHLHVREFPPMAGAGVWAFVVQSDALELRRMLKHLHHPEVSRLTNIERVLEERFRERNIGCCGIHVEEDEQGYVHLWMAWKADEQSPLKRAGVFSATTTGLEDLAWAKTGLNFE